MRKILKGDTVVVISGSSKGQKGEVLAVSGERVFVRGVNICKKHLKPNPSKNEVGGIVSKEMSIHISNVALFCERDGRGHSVGFEVSSDGIKKRVFKISGERFPV
ncbi:MULTISPECIES: 50S ribosomal protein L24 [Candidatus Ichthyocystis]|uniref:50S ribosomal protein L24 n=1 Tax=Candidatus Ichthyocystis TaxID=2929841 RepID=UPI000B80BC3F|nr:MULTISPECIES: 50S ribosomal protein L24 [Ichthyocystis]